MLNHARSVARAVAIGRRLRDHFPSDRPNPPVIYVPGIVGVKLHDRRHRFDVWGAPGGILRRDHRHADFRYREDDDGVLVDEVLHSFPIVPGLVETIVTLDLKRVLERALGYRTGRDLFFLGYDWRRDHTHLQAQITRTLDRIRDLFGRRQKVVIIGQSVANLAIRDLVRNGRACHRDAIGRWYAFGPPWRGTWNAFEMLRHGYQPAGPRFFGFTAEDAFSYPATFELLPQGARAISPTGEPIDDFDLRDPDCWIAHGLGPPGLLEADREARRQLTRRMAATSTFWARLAGEHPRDRTVSQMWFAGTANDAVTTAVCEQGTTCFDAAALAERYPDLKAQTLVRGDDHVPLPHLTTTPCGPLVTGASRAPFGDDYVLLSPARDHRSLINYGPNLAALAFDLAAVRTWG